MPATVCGAFRCSPKDQNSIAHAATCFHKQSCATEYQQVLARLPRQTATQRLTKLVQQFHCVRCMCTVWSSLSSKTKLRLCWLSFLHPLGKHDMSKIRLLLDPYMSAHSVLRWGSVVKVVWLHGLLKHSVSFRRRAYFNGVLRLVETTISCWTIHS